MKSRAYLMTTLIGMTLFYAPQASAQGGCMPFEMPAGPEYGNFITGVWTAEGTVYLGHKPMTVKMVVQDYGGMGLGQKGNTLVGTEVATYDFGNGNTFQTFITYVAVHNTDPSKFYLNATEKIIPKSGTGIFANATGTFTDHGTFGVSDWITMDGWALFRAVGVVCGVE
jgi:hypothetical protein